MAKFKIGKVVGGIGPQGIQGPSGTMKVGKITTLQPGEAATVTNTGTTENAVLDFGIPRGDDGITDLVAEYRADWSHTCNPTVAAPVVIKEIAGKTVQDGTPTPDNPVEIQGVGDSGRLVVESQGKNLIDFDEWSSKLPVTRGTAVFNKADRSIALTASETDCYTGHGESGYIVPVKANTKYTLSWDYSGAAGDVFWFLNALVGAGYYSDSIPNSQKKTTFITKADTKFITFRVGVATANTTCKYWNIQLQEGESVTPYQPYHHTTATIPLTSPLYSGDKICCVQPGESYVDEDGNRAVAHRVLWGVWRENGVAVFDGSADEKWSLVNYGNGETAVLTNITKPRPASLYCDKAQYITDEYASNATKFGITNSDVTNYIYFTCINKGLGVTTHEQWIAWLKTNTPKVVYKLLPPCFQPFPDQSPFHNLRTANGLTYIYTEDPLKPEITVDVAKQAAGGYLLEAYSDGIVGRSIAEDTSSLETTIENYYALRRTGKVYQTKIYKFASNPTSTGEKLMDNAGLVCQPSTDTVEGQDDYADIPLFQWRNVNYVRDRYGNPHPTAIEGQPGYKTSGSVDVGCMQMSFYINIDTSNAAYDLWTISDMPHPELGLVPYPGAVRADGTMAPYVIHSKYVSGYASDGLLRSQPGIRPEKWQSHNNMITNYQKKGEGYWGAGAERNFFQMVFQIIKYATKSSQTEMYGCTTYSFQYSASVQRSDKQTYFPLTNAQAANIIVGAYVSVGYGSNNNGTVNIDRGVGTMHSYADIAKVLRVETLDANNKAVYLDIAQGFATTPIALTSTLNAPITLSSMHWWSGTTDKVKGHHDGSIVSNTNGKYPYRMQGLEYAAGGYIVASDTVMDFKSDYSKDVYVAQKSTPHSSADATIRSTYKKVGNIPAISGGGDWWIGDIAVDLETGCWYPSVVGASDAQGMGDRCYGGGAATSGTREYLQGGDLGDWSVAGAACLRCWSGLGNALWPCLSCD